jgi:hypothetical protein
MKKVLTVLASVLLVCALTGCSKESCLKKYHFDSEDEFCKRYEAMKDTPDARDEAIKLHNVGKECDCKCVKD